ncbi:MAG: DUF4293 domain-containing protein [Pseudarcicella sp.]|nr:DUF4293 domain-containing protein [Pseudarcicella sp.]MBP6409737.1 DUF4293 domain-containing protein [Pseudarcicella sp.]
MFQRIQTLFLAGVSIAMLVVAAMPLWEKISTNGTEKIVLTSFSLEHFINNTSVSENNTPYIAILSIIIACVAAFSLTQYKKRILQMTLGVVNTVLIAVLIGTIFYHVFKVGIPIFEPNNQGHYQIGFIAAGLGMLFNMLANRMIRRDEMLVKSADRMR